MIVMKNGKKFTIYGVEDAAIASKFLRQNGFTVVVNSLDRAAELKRAPVRAEQPCPSCNGYGELLDTETEAYALCPDCDGTGSANRSAGG